MHDGDMNNVTSGYNLTVNDSQANASQQPGYSFYYDAGFFSDLLIVKVVLTTNSSMMVFNDSIAPCTLNILTINTINL
jgi:hypothetical protein